MLITGVLPFLPGGFHKYYALYKFYEFLPHLDLGNSKFTFCLNIFEIIYVYDSQNEPTISNQFCFSEKASIVCRTCVHQDIILSGYHPITQVIINTLLQKLTEKFTSAKLPSNEIIRPIVGFITRCGCQKSQLDEISNLFAKVAVFSQTMELQSLIDIASLTQAKRSVVTRMPKVPIAIADSICSKSNRLSKSIEIGQTYEHISDLLGYSHLLNLLSWIEGYEFTNEEERDSLVNSARIIAKAYFDLKDQVSAKRIPREYVVGIALHFLYLDVYEDWILDAVYNDDRILKPVKEEKRNKMLGNSMNDEIRDLYELKDRLVYDYHSHEALIIRRAFQMINGILDVNYPSYRKAGRFIHQSHIRYLNTWFGK